jgi:pyruvate-formate lyase-activating enzyme
MNLPFLLFTDKSEKVYSHPSLRMAASSLARFCLPQKGELLPFPEGSTFFTLTGRAPVGWDPQRKQFITLTHFKGKEVHAVSAFLIPAYLRLYTPAAVVMKKITLPLWAYTACGWYGGKCYVTATRVDSRRRQSPRFYDTALIRKKVKQFNKKYPHNRLYAHLAHCAVNHNCLAAKNLFMERWEAPLPTAQACNARCIGCLSHQESDCLASHGRIGFRPSAEEIVQVATHHLLVANEAIVSFGQGCEGEPLLETRVIAQSIARIRALTSRGTIHMNTNASIPTHVKELCRAGIDSFRISLNSIREEFYQAYFRPRGYAFRDVLKSIELAKKYKKFVSVNLFMFPGISDDEKELTALIRFIEKTGIDMLQLRNLHIDPEQYRACLPKKHFAPKTISFLLHHIRKRFPRLKMGYFNVPKEKFFVDKYFL